MPKKAAILLLPLLIVLLSGYPLHPQAAAAQYPALPFLRLLVSANAPSYGNTGRTLAAKLHAKAAETKLVGYGAATSQSDAGALGALVLSCRDSGSLGIIASKIAEKAKTGTASLPELLFLLQASAYVPVDAAIDIKAAIAKAAAALDLENAAARFLVSLLADSYGIQITYAYKKLASFGITTIEQFKSRWTEVQNYLQDKADAQSWVQKLAAGKEYAWALRLLDHAQNARIVEDAWASKTRPPIAKALALLNAETEKKSEPAVPAPPETPAPLVQTPPISPATAASSPIAGQSWTSPGGITFMAVPAGSFKSETGTMSMEAFWMARTELTQANYQSVLGSNPSFFKKDRDSSAKPVEQVSWYDAIVFCNALSIRDGLSPAYSIGGKADPAAWGSVPKNSSPAWDAVLVDRAANGYRLPTDAEWLYAARAAGAGDYQFAGSDNASEVAWYDSNSKKSTMPVGTKKANGLGLFDMSGNVLEWCWDWFENNPAGNKRIPRGGSWYNEAGASLIDGKYWKFNNAPAYKFKDLGFRIVRPS